MPHKASRSTTPVLIAQSAYLAARENYEGFCIECREITNSGVEPDARRYECESCGANAVYGIEEALLMDFIEIAADTDEED
jgi:hypothetical protein